MKTMRADFDIISSLVNNEAKVLDVGCDTGELLSHLKYEKKCDTRGIEKSMIGVRESVKAGHSVMQGDADTDLQFYPDKSFDVVILSKTIQATQAPDEVLKQITRIGKKAIIGFPNFGHYNVLRNLAFRRRMPVTEALPLTWYGTPNIHFCTIRDLVELCEKLNLQIEDYVILNKNGKVLNAAPLSYRASWFGADAILTISEKSKCHNAGK